MQKDLKEIIPLYPSLSKPILIKGVEREMVYIWSFICVYIWVAGKDMFFLSVAVILWIAGMFIGKMLAKNDPSRIKIFLRALKYRNYYSAREKLITPNIRKTKTRGKSSI